MNNHCFGCDFGSYHLKIYHKEQDSCLMQHNMVAVQDKKEMLAYGDEAYAMYEKAPANIQVSSPMSYGNLASISNMQTFLKRFLESSTKGQLKGAEYFVALPTDMQERIFTTLIQDSSMKPKTVYLVDQTGSSRSWTWNQCKRSTGCVNRRYRCRNNGDFRPFPGWNRYQPPDPDRRTLH